MAKKRLSMRKIREVLRLNHSGLSIRAIARACSIGRETVREYLCRASEAGISWPLPDGVSDEELERQLFPSVVKIYGKRSCPNWALIHQELRRRKGVTRHLLWTEYKEDTPDHYRYSRFCDLYREWTKKLIPSMRVAHKAGEKLFVDYAGLTMVYTDPSSGEEKDDTPGRHSTHPEHMPESHRHYAEYNPERFIRWAKKIGGLTEELVNGIFSRRPHPEHGYRSCLGLMRLETRYGKERLEAASKRALFFGLYSYKGVKNILEAGLDKVSLEESAGVTSKVHGNIRGTDYYS